MVQVLVLGASGFIGLPIAQALVRAGHQVFGLTRSETKGKLLAAEEITPVVGEPESDVWIKHIATLDVIIDAIGGSANIRELSSATLKRVGEAVQKSRPEGAPKLSFIYTSGIWVTGDDRNAVVTDTTPLSNTKTADLVSWRPSHEQRVLKDTIVNGIVIRPALLYGRSGSILAGLFSAASKGNVVWPGVPGGRYSLIHADDLADLYVRVTEKAPILGGQIFLAANDLTESVDDLLEKLVQISGAKAPYEYSPPSNDFERALSSTALARPYLARALLGWEAKKPGLIDGLPIYYAAFLANQK